ncbi:hypothetical protein SYNPS1DRAFT_21659 [Syncephalis pseudoplumigaleata]|uniref:Uncharacterized protein n=1 Tax=Syncephalis pseudoplumigaleata TaxID=1712513 RepID=A0A4P9Z4W0_9FUNG|nr:hypothetical protein SYNPS1DRAFT_21659 [Syncephalis pseudoplumigaleata]|eukprot:RKP26620.1 hypothetical protein SYNPS1DRAFT_21659 [Syncephalis pseudoplumigaleata]
MKSLWKRHVQKPAAAGTGQLLRKTKSSSLFRNSVILMSDIVSFASSSSAPASAKYDACEDGDALVLHDGRFDLFGASAARKRDTIAVAGAGCARDEPATLRNAACKQRPVSMPAPCSTPDATLLQSIIASKGLLGRATLVQLAQYANADACKYHQPRPLSLSSIYPQPTGIEAFQQPHVLSS